MVRLAACSMLARISETPNSPMTTGTRSNPSVRLTAPNVKRSLPLTWSMPMQAQITPSAMTMNPFAAEPCTMNTVATKPSAITAKFSGGPNFSAADVRSGENKVRPTTLSVPAMNDPMAAMPRAAPARPCRAISCPSRQVTTDAASPGMLTRIDVVDPPYMAP